jgi:hypothetical protein
MNKTLYNYRQDMMAMSVRQVLPKQFLMNPFSGNGRGEV